MVHSSGVAGVQCSILIMTPAETTGNGIETLSDRQLIEVLVTQVAVLQSNVDILQQCVGALQSSVYALQGSVDHIDTGVHGVTRFIDEHLPLLKRFTDPGAAVRGFLAPGRKVKGPVRQ